ncbi:MAG: hypothetical protein U0271_12930 [Polyangiaceae bacterium]
MKIVEGEDLRKVADNLQGAGHTAEPILRASSNVLGEVGRRLLHPMTRKARLVEFKEAEYHNAEDWTLSDDQALTVNVGVSGGSTIDIPEPIEFVHYGRVYRDRSQLFPSAKMNDLAATLGDVPAHGLMFRAALQREAVLLGGFVRAQMDALLAEEKSKGAIGVLAQVIADLTGSAGGTEDKPNAVDLNPHLQKVIEAAKKINKAKVDYPSIHECGVSLHTARKAYREYLVQENEKRHAPAKSPGGGILNDQVDEVNEALEAGHDWLGGKHDPNQPAKHDAVPKLTFIVPPSVQDFLSLIQKISFKAWDVCAGLNYEYAIRLEPIIEDACREMTVHAIKNKSAPVFPVWFLEPQAEYQLPTDVEQKIFDKIDNPLAKGTLPGLLDGLTDTINKAADVITDPIKGALQKYDQKVGIDKTLDFLSRPDRYTPGRPFLDDIFLIPPDEDPPDVPDAAKRARVGWSGGLGQMAVDCFKGALGIKKLPGFLEWIIAKVSTVCAEFIRGIYCKLLTLDENAQVTEAEMIEASRKHLVGNIIETILGGLKFVDGIRKFQLDVPIAEVAVSVDALIGRAKEFASQKLEKFIDPVIKFATRDLFGMIFAYRKTAITNRALTMEVHLAQLPTVFSRLFRNVFFPLWDMVLEKTIAALSTSLMPRIMEAGHAIMKAREQVEQVRGKIVQGLAALESLPSQLPGVGFDLKDPKGSLDKLKSDWNPIIKNAKDAWDNAELDVTQDLPGMEGDPLETGFPVQKRLNEAELEEVTPTNLKKVKPDLKWKEPAPVKQAAATDASKQAAPTDVANGPQQGAPKAYSGEAKGVHQPPQLSEPIPSYPLGDYPLADESSVPTSQNQYSQYQQQYAQQYSQQQSYDYGDYSQSDYGSGDYGYSPQSQSYYGYNQQQQNQYQQQAFADPSTADIPAMPSAEKTTEFGISPDMRQLAQIEDVEQTVDLDSVALSALPPFLGPNKKA